MVGRFGFTEVDTLIHYENFLEMNLLEKLHEWSSTSRYPFLNCILNDIHRQSGFYPVTKRNIALFKEEMLSSMKRVDLLASWVKARVITKIYAKRKSLKLIYSHTYQRIHGLKPSKD